MKRTLFFLTTVLLLLASCQDTIEEIKETVDTAEDAGMAETSFFGVYEVSDDVMSSDERLGKTSGTILPSGASVIFTDTSFADGNGVDFYIDFGLLDTAIPQGLLCKDGKYRAGRINITLDKPYTEIGAVATLTINDNDEFYTGNGQDMYKLTGVKTLTRTAENQITIDVANATLFEGDYSLTWSCNRIITRTYDNGPGVWGDEFEITGSGNGVNRSGNAYQINITEKLLKKMNAGCAKTFIDGNMTLDVDNGKELKMEFDPYNDQACDRAVEVEIAGTKKIINVN